jgi:hypothetical protein
MAVWERNRSVRYWDVFEVEDFLVDALDLSRVDDPAIEDARDS